MAKGRRHHGGYNADRLLGTLANGGGYAANGRATDDLPDLAEGDVWSSSALDSDDGGWHRREARRTDPTRTRRWDEHRQVGGLSLAFENGYDTRPTVVHQYRNVEPETSPQTPRGRSAAASAPVNVPVWPRFLRFESGESLVHEPGGLDQSAWMVEEEEGESEWMPPHEYLAREHGRRRSGSVAMSVFEGVGRTLKGRDMSRVRDAVWSQTGFFG